MGATLWQVDMSLSIVNPFQQELGPVPTPIAAATFKSLEIWSVAAIVVCSNLLWYAANLCQDCM